jgi:hypothetical protein
MSENVMFFVAMARVLGWHELGAGAGNRDADVRLLT